MQKKVSRLLWPYRWQIGLLPFSVCSIWLAVSLTGIDKRAEFIGISAAYALADVLIINSFVAEKKKTRAFSQVVSILIFAFVFLYTYFAHHEIEYALTMPLFWVAAWKRVSEEMQMKWYPRMLDERALGALALSICIIAYLLFRYTATIPTIINFAQVVGVDLFGMMLAIGTDARLERRPFLNIVGTTGLWIFVLACVGDVVYKYNVAGILIATPLVAFFAALPVAIVTSREMIKTSRASSV